VPTDPAEIARGESGPAVAPDLVALANSVAPSLVGVTAYYGSDPGTGIVLNPDGLVLTNQQSTRAVGA